MLFRSLADVEACVAQDPPAVLCVELGQRMNGGACVPWKELLELRAPNAFLSAAEVRRLPRGHAGAPYENCCPSADQLADKPLKVLSISHGAPRLPPPNPWLPRRISALSHALTPRLACPPRPCRC